MDLKEDIKVIFTQKNNTHITILEVLIFFVSFSIPFSYAFNSICFGLLFCYSFIWFNKNKFNYVFFRRYSVSFLFILYFLIQVIGVFYTDNQAKGFSNVIKNAIFLIMPITFANIFSVLNYRKLEISFYGLITGVFVILFSAHINIFINILRENLEYKLLLTHFVRVQFVNKAIVEIHPPYLGLLTVFCLVLIHKMSLNINRNAEAILKNILITYFAFSLYEISSFMSFLLLLFLGISYVFVLIKNKKITRLLITLSLVFVLIFICVKNFSNGITDYSGGSMFKRIEWSFFKGKGDTSRPENWKSVLKVSKDNLFFGVGSDGGIEKLQKHRKPIYESYKNKHNAHNQYLEVLLRFGIIGLTVFMFTIYELVKLAYSSKDILFCWFLVVFCFSCLTESYLQRQIGLTFFVLYSLLFSTFFNFKNK